MKEGEQSCQEMIILQALLEERYNHAFKCLYKNCYPMVRQFIYQHGGREQDAKDTFQEAILVFYTKCTNGNYRHEAKFCTFVFKVAANIYYKSLRKKRREQPLNELDERSDEMIDSSFEENDKDNRIKIVKACLKKLNEKYQQLIIAYYLERKTYDEIVKELEFKNIHTATVSKYKGMERLKKCIKNSR